MKRLAEYLAEHYSSQAVKGYENMIRRYQLSMGQRARAASYTEILDYIGELREQGLHPKTLRNHLFAIKIYFNYRIAMGKQEEHPCRHLYLKDQIDRQVHVDNLYSRERLEDLYENHQAKNPRDQQREKLIISLLIYQGLNVTEISELRAGDINLKEGRIRIRSREQSVKRSGNKERTLGLKSKQILLINNYLKEEEKEYINNQEERKRTDYLLVNEGGLQMWKGGISRMINRGKKSYERLLPIKIRQSVIANLLKEGKDLRIVQEFAGHRRTSSTEAYRQTGLEELKSVINKLHPRG